MANHIFNARRFKFRVHKLNYQLEHWIYVGRGYGELKASPLGNPYRLRQHKGDTLPLYRKWLWSQIEAGNEAVIESLKRIRPHTTIICHCNVPEKCHGSIVVAAANWIRGTDL